MLAQAYLPALIAIVVGIGLAGTMLVLAMILGPKRVTAVKAAPFECGSEPVGSPRVRFSVRFYPVAILFLVFDIEAAFLYPWAVLFRDLSCAQRMEGACVQLTLFGLAEMAVFLGVLVVALVYVARKKAIGWE
jgi:NADH-quinone oxidoreductase subunit A